MLYKYKLKRNDGMHKKLVSAFVALGVALSCTSNALAAPLQEQYNSSLQQYQNALKGVQEIEEKISITDKEKGKINDDISAINKKIAESQSKIEQEQKKLAQSEEEMDSEQKIYKQRIKAMYMNNINTQYFDVILNSRTFSELVGNVENVKNLMQYDSNIMNNIIKQKQDIDKQKKALEVDNSKLQKLQGQNKSKLDALNAKQAEQNKLLASQKVEEDKHKVDMEKIQSAMDAEKKKIAALSVPQAPAVSPTTPQSSASGLAIVKEASKYLGIKYVYGGTTPAGFDCSGLVQYVYARFGISLPRTSEEQVGAGSPVTGNLQPGDLVFFEPASDGPGHVGIYAGNDTFIEAPHTGANVRISPMRAYCAARRILK